VTGMTEVSYETEQLQKLASQLTDLKTYSKLEAMPEKLKLMSDVWPFLFMDDTPTQYDSLCESVEKAVKAVLSMTGTLGESLDGIAAAYAKQEAEAGKDIESLAD
jgi:hypothetical protein